jgi:hypothetical protein
MRPAGGRGCFSPKKERFMERGGSYITILKHLLILTATF